MVLQDGYAPDFMDSPAWIAQLLARWRIESNLCRDMMDDSGLLPTLNTATHARDIDSIREALGLEKIRFWGFSWGSALGGYYATLFPHRIERFVSEGQSRANHTELIAPIMTDMEECSSQCRPASMDRYRSHP